MNKIIPIQAVKLDEIFDLLRIVFSMYAESFANIICQTRVAKVEFDMEDISVVCQRSKTAVLLNMNGVGLDGEVRAKARLGAVGFLEQEPLGGGLPATHFGNLFCLFFLERHEAVGLDDVGGRQFSNLGLGPGRRDFDGK